MQDSYQYTNNTIALFVTQFCVRIWCYGSPNLRNIYNFACLKAQKKFVIDCELLDMLVTNIWNQLMQIIIYLPSSS